MGSTPIKSGETTTGNATGIKININKEWVAAACEEIKGSWPRFGNAVGRYKDVYQQNYKEKIGDAIATVGIWHGAKECAWIDYVPYRGLVRSRSGSLFSYCGHSQYNDANWDLSWTTRAVVVVGSKL